MACFVSKPNGVWEIRESRSTPAGPRSRTLATFRVLTLDVLEKARSRASGTLDVATLQRAARRAGAPIEPSVADRATAELLSELEAGRRARPALERALLGALRGDPPDATRSAAAWACATPERRGEALCDLLLLVDSLPPRKQTRLERFPRVESSPL